MGLVLFASLVVFFSLPPIHLPFPFSKYSSCVYRCLRFSSSPLIRASGSVLPGHSAVRGVSNDVLIVIPMIDLEDIIIVIWLNTLEPDSDVKSSKTNVKSLKNCVFTYELEGFYWLTSLGFPYSSTNGKLLCF